MHLVRALAECLVCKKVWEANNSMGVAARHNQSTGHEVMVEMTYSHRFKEPARQKSAKQKKQIPR